MAPGAESAVSSDERDSILALVLSVFDDQQAVLLNDELSLDITKQRLRDTQNCRFLRAIVALALRCVLAIPRGLNSHGSYLIFI